MENIWNANVSNMVAIEQEMDMQLNSVTGPRTAGQNFWRGGRDATVVLTSDHCVTLTLERFSSSQILDLVC